MDYFRTDCIKSYFELVALVNKGNRIINEQTEAKFFIVGEAMFLGINQTQKIQLCKRTNHWYPSNVSGHTNFEKFNSQILNRFKIVSGEVNQLIKTELFK